MNNALGQPIKNIFSKAALAALNACAKFAYNFAQGFGIKLTRNSNSVVVSLDTESVALSEWVNLVVKKEVAPKDANENFALNGGGDSQGILSGLKLDTAEWERGVTVKKVKSGNDWVDYKDENGNTVLAGIRMQVVSRVRRSLDTDYYFWRWAYFDRNGALYKLSAEQGVFAAVNYEGYTNF